MSIRMRIYSSRGHMSFTRDGFLLFNRVDTEVKAIMNEIRESIPLGHYLSAHGIDSIVGSELLPYVSLYRYEPGDVICNQGEQASCLYILVKGKVKIYYTSAEGKTLIHSFKKPPEAIGDIEYVRGTEIRNTVEAVSSVDMLGIPYRWLDQYGKEHPPFLNFLLQVIARKFADKSNSLKFNMLYPVEVRLASYLLSATSDENGDSFRNELSSADLADAANLIGTSYRHMNRIILQFCKDGLVERNGASIRLKNRDQLKELSSNNIYE